MVTKEACFIEYVFEGKRNSWVSKDIATKELANNTQNLMMESFESWIIKTIEEMENL